MSEKKRKLLKQTSLLNFMCGNNQSKRQRTDMDKDQKQKVREAAEYRRINDSNGETGASSVGLEMKSEKPSISVTESNSDSEEHNIPKKKQAKDCAFKGVPLAELNTSAACYSGKSDYNIKASEDHTVLYQLPLEKNHPPIPHPSHFTEGWNSDHVHMPCSKKNEYPLETESGIQLMKRWSLIEKTYENKISGPIELEKAILSYNKRHENRWNFYTLRKYFTDFLSRTERQHFFDDVLPKIIKLALQLPNLCTKPIPLLKQNKNQSISLSQQQAGCLLANAFLCTFPRRNSRHKGSEYANYPDINFSGLYQRGFTERKLQKLKCIIHYFERITTKMPCGVLTFTRQYLANPLHWTESRHLLPEKIHVSSSGTIEDNGFGFLQVDFANKYLGGGVLGRGCVQEEIRFLICPELILSRLFTEVLGDKECLIMKGCERFSNYDGYADSFEWKENHIDVTPSDENGRRYTDVVAIDALVMHGCTEQFGSYMLCRELTKAYVGFEELDARSSLKPAVCTGNWGCGAFGGDKQLKALIQLMAAGQAGRDVCYYTFNDIKLQEEIFDIYTYLREQEVEIGVLVYQIMEYKKVLSHRSRNKIGLFEFILQRFEGSNHSESSEEENVYQNIESEELDIHESSKENSLCSEEDMVDLDMDCDVQHLQDIKSNSNSDSVASTSKQSSKETVINDKDNNMNNSKNAID